MAITYSDIARVNGEIKTVKIKTKNYAEVSERVNAFRKLFPNGSIQTELLSMAEGMCVIKATVYDADMKPLASGMAYEKEGSSKINLSSYIENCETSAVGRALGFLGLTGSGMTIASYEEMANAQAQQESIEPIDEQRKTVIKTLCDDVDKPVPDFTGWTKGKGDRCIQRLMEIRAENDKKGD